MKMKSKNTDMNVNKSKDDDNNNQKSSSNTFQCRIIDKTAIELTHADGTEAAYFDTHKRLEAAGFVLDNAFLESESKSELPLMAVAEDGELLRFVCECEGLS